MMHLLQGISRWRQRWDRFEAAVGLIAAFMLAFGPFTVAALVLIFSLILAEWRVAGLAAVVTAVTCPMAVWLAWMANSALQKFHADAPVDAARTPRRPAFAMLLASELPPLPGIARVPLALWWLTHFAAGAALVVFADVLVREGLLWDGFTKGVPAAVFGYLFYFAANIFLVLAVAACFGSPTVTAGVWRRRFAIDGLFTIPLLLRIVL